MFNKTSERHIVFVKEEVKAPVLKQSPLRVRGDNLEVAQELDLFQKIEYQPRVQQRMPSRPAAYVKQPSSDRKQGDTPRQSPGQQAQANPEYMSFDSLNERTRSEKKKGSRENLSIPQHVIVQSERFPDE